MRKIFTIMAFAIMLTTIAGLTFAHADSLLKECEGFANLYGSKVAAQQGDLVTIVFNERTISSQSAKGKMKNTYTVGTDQGKGLLQFFLGIGIGGGDTTDVEQTIVHQSSLSHTMSAVVKEVYPNGNMRIEGCKNVVIDHEVQKVTVTGIIRPTDITKNNTIDSSNIADLDATLDGLPIDKSLKKKRGGIIRWIWDILL